MLETPIPVDTGGETLRLASGRGPIVCRLHRSVTPGPRIVRVFGAGGGLGGPAGCVYERLAARLQPEGASSLQVAYRRPGDLDQCLFDTLAGAAYLQSQAVQAGRIALVGHSFGGAVVIAAGAASPMVSHVVAMSSQTYGADAVVDLSPRPLLLIHGTADGILSDSCSRALYGAAGEPKKLILYPECSHGLDECRDDLDRDLLAWLRQHLLAEPQATTPAA